MKRALAFGLLIVVASSAVAQSVDPFYADALEVTKIGMVPALPAFYGFIHFKPGDNSKIWLGGLANSAEGGMYEATVLRDFRGHVTGFGGLAHRIATAPYNDGGFEIAPNGTALFSQWPVNRLGQIKPGSNAPDKSVDLAALGSVYANSTVLIVPPAYTQGAGRLKLISWPDGEFYDSELIPDGNGTYDVAPLNYKLSLPGGPEGALYMDSDFPYFGGYMFVAEFLANRIAYYDVDESGDPTLSYSGGIIHGLLGAEGLCKDPLTGDLLVTTFSNQPAVYRIRKATATISGQLNLQGLIGNVEYWEFRLDVRRTSDNGLVQSSINITGATGNIATYTLAYPGLHSVSVKTRTHLRRTLTNVSFSETGVNGLVFNLIAGDLNDDNEVSLPDYTLLAHAFGSLPGDANWYPDADINGDGEVSLPDYVILAGNFGQIGDD